MRGEALIAAAPVPLAVFSADGTRLAASQAFLALPDAPDPRAPLHASAFRRALAGETITSGGATWFPAEGGAAVSVSAPDRVRTQLEGLLERMPVAFALHEGPELIFRLANRAYRAYFGGRDLTGLPMADVLPPLARSIPLLRRVYQTGEPYANAELSLRVDRTGSGFNDDAVLSFMIEPLLEEGRVTGLFTLAVDVTEPVEARRRAQALAGDLESAVQAREDFLSVAAHELRTPITALSLRVEHALRLIASGEVELPVIESSLKTTLRNTRRLTALMNDLLDVSRIAAGRMRLAATEVDLVALVRDLLQRHDDLRVRAGCEIELRAEAASVVGHWDRGRIDQVFTNLLTNALKYGAGRPVAVEIGAGDPVRLAISDGGLGIHPQDQARVFERFERVASRSFGGLGLGLWIVREVVTAHGGSVSVSSVPSEGATFTVLLPRRPAALVQES